MIRSFMGEISSTDRGPTLMLEPGIQPLIRHLVHSYQELERRAAKLGQKKANMLMQDQRKETSSGKSGPQHNKKDKSYLGASLQILPILPALDIKTVCVLFDCQKQSM